MDIQHIKAYIKQCIKNNETILGLTPYKANKLIADINNFDTLTLQDIKNIQEANPHIAPKYVGIDLGTSHLMTASDITRTNTLVYHPEHFNVVTYNLAKIKNTFPNNNQTTNVNNDRIDSILKSFIDSAINALLKQYSAQNTIFLLGNGDIDFAENNPNHSDSITEQMFKNIIRLFKERLTLDVPGRNIRLVSERKTSITCPQCHTVDPKSRDLKLNNFKCNSCGFTHDVNDVVAAANFIINYTTENRPLQSPKTNDSKEPESKTLSKKLEPILVIPDDVDIKPTSVQELLSEPIVETTSESKNKPKIQATIKIENNGVVTINHISGVSKELKQSRLYEADIRRFNNSNANLDNKSRLSKLKKRIKSHTQHVINESQNIILPNNTVTFEYEHRPELKVIVDNIQTQLQGKYKNIKIV